MKGRAQCLIVGLGNPGHKYQYTRHNIGFLAVQHFARHVLGTEMSKRKDYDVCSRVLHFDKTKFFKELWEKRIQRENNRIEHEKKRNVVLQQQQQQQQQQQGINDNAMTHLHTQKIQEPIDITMIDEEKLKEEVNQNMRKSTIFDEVEVHCILPMNYMNNSGVQVRNYVDNVLRQSFKKLQNSNNKRGFFRIIVCCDDISMPFNSLKFKFKGGCGGHNGLLSIEKQTGTERYHRLKFGISPRSGMNVHQMRDYVISPFTYDERASLDQLFHHSSSILYDYLFKDLSLVMTRANSLKL